MPKFEAICVDCLARHHREGNSGELIGEVVEGHAVEWGDVPAVDDDQKQYILCPFWGEHRRDVAAILRQCAECERDIAVSAKTTRLLKGSDDN